jgi:excinuclease ABC subunit C
MARDEAHRFAVTFQRARRTKRTVTSQLLEIPGVGPNRRRALLKEFGSVQGVKDAGLDAISRVPGFSKAMATKVLTGLGIPIPVEEEAPAPSADAGAADPATGPDASPIASSTSIESTAE